MGSLKTKWRLNGVQCSVTEQSTTSYVLTVLEYSYIQDDSKHFHIIIHLLLEKNPDKIRDADDGTRSRKISNVRNESSKSQTIPIIVVVIVVAVGILVVFAIYKYKKMVAARPEVNEQSLFLSSSILILLQVHSRDAICSNNL